MLFPSRALEQGIARQRKIYHHHLGECVCEWRRLLRTSLGPTLGLRWSLPWHEIFHHWTERVRDFQLRLHLQGWSEIGLKHHWRFARHVSCVPSSRWVKHAMYVAVAAGLKILGPHSWRLLRELWGGKSGWTMQRMLAAGEIILLLASHLYSAAMMSRFMASSSCSCVTMSLAVFE